MAKRIQVKRKYQTAWKDRPTRFDQIDDKVLAARWNALLPRALRGSLLFASLALALFAFNHLARPGQTLTNVINIAFQIASVFTACLLFLAGISLGWRRRFARAAVNRNPQSTEQ